jgi:hypothetical protein
MGFWTDVRHSLCELFVSNQSHNVVTSDSLQKGYASMLTLAGITALNQLPSVDNTFPSRLGFDAAVVPEQFFSLPHVQRERPEATLMRAVLEEALACFQYQFYARRPGSKQLARDAEEWFFSDATSWPFAFVNICEVLHLDPEYIRRGLRRWQANWPLKIPQRKRRTVGTRRPLKAAA